MMAVRALGLAALIAVLMFGPGIFALKAPSADLWRPHMPDLGLIAGASLAIKVHLATVAAAALTGVVLMIGRKGTPFHRQLGWVYASAMFITGLVTLSIPRPQFGPHIGPFGPLHLFSLTALIGVPAAIHFARQQRWDIHGRIMAGLFVGGVGVAGLGAFTPGRLLWRVLFG